MIFEISLAGFEPAAGVPVMTVPIIADKQIAMVIPGDGTRRNCRNDQRPDVHRA